MSKKYPEHGIVFTPHEEENKTPFERLFDIFMELITYTSGDVDEALDWMDQLDEEYELYTAEYTKEDFIEDLKKKGYLRDDEDDPQQGGGMVITEKTERAIRQSALEQIFGKLRKSGYGNHRTKYLGKGDEQSGETRAYHFGDALDQISMTESIRNAQVNHGIGNFKLTEQDLVVNDTHHKAQMSTVLMIDISHRFSINWQTN